MRRPAAAALLALLLVLSASPVAAHGNHVEADSQRSTDGTVYVEAVRPQTDGFLVLHRETPDGDFGEPIGHTKIDFDEGFQSNVPVEMADEAWADWSGHDSLWIVFHADDGDGEFSPGDDPATEAFGRVTGRSITLARGDQPARVLAERSSPQQTETTRATVDEVAMPEDGFLVLSTGNATNGTVVASTSLPAGVHEDVSLTLDESAFAGNQSTIGLYAQVYGDDGDGEFDDETVVRAGSTPVNTYFLVWQVDNATGTTTDPVVQTPTTDGDVVTPTEDESTQQVDATTTAPASDSTVPGYGLVQGAVALLLAALLLVRMD